MISAFFSWKTFWTIKCSLLIFLAPCYHDKAPYKFCLETKVLEKLDFFWQWIFSKNKRFRNVWRLPWIFRTEDRASLGRARLFKINSYKLSWYFWSIDNFESREWSPLFNLSLDLKWDNLQRSCLSQAVEEHKVELESVKQQAAEKEASLKREVDLLKSQLKRYISAVNTLKNDRKHTKTELAFEGDYHWTPQLWYFPNLFHYTNF